MFTLERLIILLLIIVGVLCASEEPQTKFTTLPFSFGLVLNAFKFEDSQEVFYLPEAHAPMPLKESFEQQEEPGLQAISVAEVLREPSARKSRAGPSVIPLACLSESVLELDLNEGSLTSRQHYIASVDDSHQFTFEELENRETYTPGTWSVSAKGQLEYQDIELFYQCHSGESYKLYDAPVHSRCAPVLLDVVELVSCQ